MKRSHVDKSYASSYNVDILNSFNHELQFKNTEYTVRSKLIDLLSKLRGFKFVTMLVIESRKIESDGAAKYITFCSNSNAETIINESDIDDVFESIYTTFISKIQKYLGKGSGWITDSVIDHIINIS